MSLGKTVIITIIGELGTRNKYVAIVLFLQLVVLILILPVAGNVFWQN